jgi:hypothetical protein
MSMRKQASPISSFLEKQSPSKSKLTIQTFVEKEGIEEEYVLIEGRPESLRFLANLILTFVDSDEGCGFFFHPKGPGSIYFRKRSRFGIYLHKLPCELHASAKKKS